jgi:hypothetical protein
MALSDTAAVDIFMKPHSLPHTDLLVVVAVDIKALKVPGMAEMGTNGVTSAEQEVVEEGLRAHYPADREAYTVVVGVVAMGRLSPILPERAAKEWYILNINPLPAEAGRHALPDE